MSGPVNNIPNANLDNRLSPLQRAILGYLRSVSAFGPRGEYIGHLPRTGQIVVGVGKDRDKAATASVSRSLKRLCASGLVVAYSPSICTQGMGLHYALASDDGKPVGA